MKLILQIRMDMKKSPLQIKMYLWVINRVYMRRWGYFRCESQWYIYIANESYYDENSKLYVGPIYIFSSSSGMRGYIGRVITTIVLNRMRSICSNDTKVPPCDVSLHMQDKFEELRIAQQYSQDITIKIKDQTLFIRL